MNENKIRINKYLSQAGFCSRREADKYITDERVTINGVIAEMGEKIDLEDTIAVDGEKISKKPNKKIYIILNKPKGIVCTTDSGVEKDNIIDYINLGCHLCITDFKCIKFIHRLYLHFYHLPGHRRYPERENPASEMLGQPELQDYAETAGCGLAAD